MDGPISALLAERDATWAVADDRLMYSASSAENWHDLAGMPTGTPGESTCLLFTAGGLLLGTAGAHLFQLAGDQWERLESFESAEGRAGWYTPWGGPPDTRSLSQDDQGNLYANVHVGGIAKSIDGGHTWHSTINIDADVHQVIVIPQTPGSLPGSFRDERPARLLAATSRGLAISDDGGTTWRFHTGGMEGTYCRAVAVAARMLLVTVSGGPGGKRAGLFRRALNHAGPATSQADRPFQRCRMGLPEWFSSNIDTYCLSADGELAVFGVATGSVFASQDSGETWQALADDLGAVRCVLASQNGGK